MMNYNDLVWVNMNSVSQNSFYGKAKIARDNNAGVLYLKSYDTVVCALTDAGTFIRLWPGYSVTTIKHINDFRRINGMDTLSKKEWIKLDCMEEQELYKVEISNGFFTHTETGIFTYREAEKEVERLKGFHGGRDVVRIVPV